MTTVRVVNVVAAEDSNETIRNWEPLIAVNPSNPAQIVITADTPPPNNAGYWYSYDGGATWQKNFSEPGEMLEESTAFGASGELYWEMALDEADPTVRLFRTPSLTAPGPLSEIDTPRVGVDQPYLHAFTFPGSAYPGQDRLYAGYIVHDDGIGLAAATVDVSMNGLASLPGFTPVQLDFRSAVPKNGYEVRPAAGGNGEVYVAYKHWRSFNQRTKTVMADIVVARDNIWGQNGFTDLKDTDGFPGMRVVQNIRILEDQNLGSQRLNNDLSIAVDPNNSAIVYIVWGDNQSANYTLRVRRSTTFGASWSGDLLTVPDANLACLAINSDGKVGFMYQKLVSGAWETHFQRTTDASGLNWDDLLLASTPLAAPAPEGVADYSRLISVGMNFYGAFPAVNTPDPANFPATPPTAGNPNGAVFFRHTSTVAPWQLLGTAGQVIAPSVDPFFFVVQDDEPIPPTGLSASVS